MRHLACAILVSTACFFGTAPSDTQAAVGRTQGTFDVSPTGAATYQIPVWVPPGPRGIQPNLAISYSSQAGDGVMGPGWAVTGLPAITRCNKTIAQDTLPAAVTLSSTDGYCFNGNRLRLVSGIYGAHGSVYQTEIADFSKIVAYGTATDGATVQNGPAWFEVWGKDGLIYQYGNTGDPDYPANNSRVKATGTNIATQWLLNKVRDRAGNKYVVKYGSGEPGSTGIGVPTNIYYTPSSVGATTYNYTVTFNYGTDTSDGGIEVGYVGGTLVKNTSLLANITISYGSTVVHKYNFTYQGSSSTTRARLATIQECAGTGGTDCLAPTQMTYQEGEVGVVDFPEPVASWWAYYGDFNRDGKTDYLYRSSSATNHEWYVQLSTGYGFSWSMPTGINGNGINENLFVTVGRFTGTQADTILAKGSDGALRVYAFNENEEDPGFTSTSLGFSISGSYVSADINGDGYADIARYNGSDRGIYYRLNSGGTTPSFAAEQRASGDYGTGTEGLLGSTHGDAFDFNGDGREDLMLGNSLLTIQQDGSFQSAAIASQSLGRGDFNDDGCTDLLQGKSIYVSACNGSSPAVLEFQPTDYTEDAV